MVNLSINSHVYEMFLSVSCDKNVVCFLLSNSPASEFYMPTFRNTLFHLNRQVGMKYDWIEKCWNIYTRNGLGRKYFRPKPFPV